MTDTLPPRIKEYIKANGTRSYKQIVSALASKGIGERQALAALAVVGRDPNIKTRNVKGEVHYSHFVPPPPRTPTHTTWVNGRKADGTPNYPPMTQDNDGSGIDVDFSYLFLTPEELLEYKAQAKGMSLAMLKFKHGKHARRENTAQDHAVS